VLITHKLDEVIDVSDTITVMRQGATVARMPARRTRRSRSPRAWSAATSRSRSTRIRAARARASVVRPLLDVRDLTCRAAGARRRDNGDFSIAPGEILGIAAWKAMARRSSSKRSPACDSRGDRYSAARLWPVHVRERGTPGSRTSRKTATSAA
jgi:ABC-type sugar transport system ATPase subunit